MRREDESEGEREGDEGKREGSGEERGGGEKRWAKRRIGKKGIGMEKKGRDLQRLGT